MRPKASGFTLIELMFVIVIGSILVMIGLSTFQDAQARFAARGAKTMYATLHARARSRAIETGQTVILYVDTVGDSALMISNGAIQDITRFRSQLQVDLRATPPNFFLCMTPRGYADPGCAAYAFSATSPSAAITLEFWLGADSTSVTILPMGQLVGM